MNWCFVCSLLLYELNDQMLNMVFALNPMLFVRAVCFGRQMNCLH